MGNKEKYIELREKYKVFRYKSFELEKGQDSINIAYNFEIDDLCTFRPTIRISTENLDIANDFDSVVAKKIIFNLGLVELISYWKAACPEKVIVECGNLDNDDKKWWKKLYFGGLGEFFYRNGIDASLDDFMQIETAECKGEFTAEFNNKHINIIPVGGGKDSVVTTQLLSSVRERNMFFTVNDQIARTECVLAAGYDEKDIIRTHRTIDKNLLDLNAKGFLNGHTPFSAIVAFLSLYCAYLVGAENIILSNESSANDSNIAGTEINHQYSKSYEFERDFRNYVSKNILPDIRYFSLLRAFNELQIAAQFSQYKQYHRVFRSCNAGSKKNIWCCDCAKCLFVYSILSAFLSREELVEIFGEDLFEKESLKDIFDGLVGISEVKPFECVGTNAEINLALSICIEKYKKENTPLPFLLKYFNDNMNVNDILKTRFLLKEFNEVNNIPCEFMPFVKEMLKVVSELD